MTKNKRLQIGNQPFLLKGKRGMYDFLVFIIVVASLALFVLIMQYVLPQVTGALRSSPMNTSNLSMNALNQSDAITGSFNYIFLVIFIGLTIGLIISSALISVNKIFVPVFIIFFIIDIIVGVIMNNVYEAFANDPTFASSLGGFTFGNYIMDHYVLILIAMGILSFIVIFAKAGGNGAEKRL
jgi:hypothetical protein